jgi:hypothetical protein
MAGKTAVLSVRIISDSKDAQKGFDETRSAADRFKSGLNKASIVAGVVSAGLIKLGKDAYQSASDLQQSAGGIDAVFGSSAKAMHKWAQSAAQNFGLSENSANEFAAVLGAQLKNAGTPMDQVAGKTKSLVALGSDLAATYGGTTSDAVAALSSALKGEMDPIERYGISLNQAQLQAQALAMGIKGNSSTWTTAQKQQIIMAALTKQSGDAQGQFAKQSNTAAEQQQITTAKWENASAKLGSVLLPVVTQITNRFGQLATWVQKNSGTVTVLIGVIGGLAAGILVLRAAITAWQIATKAMAIAQVILNAAMSANPIGLIILAIVALIAIIVLIVTHWKEVQAVAVAVWNAIWSVIQTVAQWIWQNLIMGPLQFIIDTFRNIQAVNDAVWAAIWQAILNVATWIYQNLILGPLTILMSTFRAVQAVAVAVWNAIVSGVQTVINWIATNLIAGPLSVIQGTFKAVQKAGAAVWDAIVGGIKTVIKWVQDAIGWLSQLFGAQNKAQSKQNKVTAAYAGPRQFTPDVSTYAAGPSISQLVAGGLSRADAAGLRDIIINLTVNGALDKDATARQIIDALDAYFRGRGRLSAAGASVAGVLA